MPVVKTYLGKLPSGWAGGPSCRKYSGWPLCSTAGSPSRWGEAVRGKAAIPPRLRRQRCLHHLRSPVPGRGTCTGSPVPPTLLAYLEVAAMHGVVQCCAARAVRDIDSAQQGDDGLHALGGPVGSGDVQRRLPILVAGIDVCRVLQEEVKCLLAGAEESRALTQPAGARRSSPAGRGRLQLGLTRAFSGHRAAHIHTSLQPREPEGG